MEDSTYKEINKAVSQNTEPFDDLDLSEVFNIVLEKGIFKNYITEVAKLVRNGELNKENLDNLLKEYHTDCQNAKLDLLDLLLSYVNIIIDDHIITEKERRNAGILKLFFRIKEGDFYKHRYDEIKSICQNQFLRLYRDNNIDYNEELFTVEMQGLFDLSYSQINEFKQDEIIRALQEGASIVNLDTDRIPKM
jgi:hypothetical protein